MSASGVGAYGTVAVGATAVLVVNGTSSRRAVTIQNVHATQVLYLGTNDQVATTTGLKVAAGGEKVIEGYNGPIWGIASGAATDTRYFESGG